MKDWKIFIGNSEPHEDWKLPDAPKWRGENRREERGKTFQAREEEVKMVNAALYLRRPLLVQFGINK